VRNWLFCLVLGRCALSLAKATSSAVAYLMAQRDCRGFLFASIMRLRQPLNLLQLRRQNESSIQRFAAHARMGDR
jgi:hypothetical protein